MTMASSVVQRSALCVLDVEAPDSIPGMIIEQQTFLNCFWPVVLDSARGDFRCSVLISFQAISVGGGHYYDYCYHYNYYYSTHCDEIFVSCAHALNSF